MDIINQFVDKKHLKKMFVAMIQHKKKIERKNRNRDVKIQLEV